MGAYKGLSTVESSSKGRVRLIFDLVSMQQIDMTNGHQRAMRRLTMNVKPLNADEGLEEHGFSNTHAVLQSMGDSVLPPPPDAVTHPSCWPTCGEHVPELQKPGRSGGWRCCAC